MNPVRDDTFRQRFTETPKAFPISNGIKILAVDTSTDYLCLGLYDGKNFYEYGLEVGRQLSCLLIPTVKRVLDRLSLRTGDIDYFACGLGPGSFTGLRIGLAAVKGLSWAHKKPVIGISTLDILAAAVKDTLRPVVPIIDAKRGLVYCAVYKNNKKISPYMLLNEKELFKKIKDNSIIFGSGVNLYREKLLRQIKASEILEKGYWYPKGHNIINLALERIKGKLIGDSFTVKPIYLYPKECQIK